MNESNIPSALFYSHSLLACYENYFLFYILLHASQEASRAFYHEKCIRAAFSILFVGAIRFDSVMKGNDSSSERNSNHELV